MNNKNVPNYLITIPDDIKKDDVMFPYKFQALCNKRKYLFLKFQCSKEKDTPAHQKDDNSQADGSQKEELAKSSSKSESIIDVFRSPILLKRLIIMFLAW